MATSVLVRARVLAAGILHAHAERVAADATALPLLGEDVSMLISPRGLKFKAS